MTPAMPRFSLLLFSARILPAAALLLFGVASLSIPTAHAAKAPGGFSMHEAPRPLPDLVFRDGDGRPVHLHAFRGKVVVLNLWATWCAPCRREMPTLDRLQAKLGGADLQVLTLSEDTTGPATVRRFFGQIGVGHLPVYLDAGSKVLDRLGVFGLPTTLLISRDGAELGRLIGPAEWDSPEMIRFLRRVIGSGREHDRGKAPHVSRVTFLR